MGQSFWTSWLRWWAPRRRGRLAGLDVTLVTRQGCHLCDDAWHLLQRERDAWGFDLHSVDVDDDAELTTAYGEQVPVVLVAGRKRFWGRIDPFPLQRLLQAEANRSRQ